MANGTETQTPADRHASRTRYDASGLPLGAPRRARARIDFGSPPIQSSAPPCSIVDSEHKHRGGHVIDV
jgi:hypothetical protein